MGQFIYAIIGNNLALKMGKELTMKKQNYFSLEAYMDVLIFVVIFLLVTLCTFVA